MLRLVERRVPPFRIWITSPEVREKIARQTLGRLKRTLTRARFVKRIWSNGVILFCALIADRSSGDDMHDRREQMHDLLRKWRGRLVPADVNLPAGRRRRVTGLRATEVAELTDVSPGWYEQFESGTSQRKFSPSFVQRVAAALRLNADEKATLLWLALPEVASAARVFETNAHDGAARYVSLTREFLRRLTAAASFEEASFATVEACQKMIAPTCATVASIETGSGPPRSFAAGPRSAYVGPRLAQKSI
jgi:transcriptional regulator with XRE-family HTH domain